MENLKEEITMIADAISAHAGAVEHLATAIDEFVKCSCSVDALGGAATHPTFIIHNEKEE